MFNIRYIDQNDTDEACSLSGYDYRVYVNVMTLKYVVYRNPNMLSHSTNTINTVVNLKGFVDMNNTDRLVMDAIVVWALLRSYHHEYIPGPSLLSTGDDNNSVFESYNGATLKQIKISHMQHDATETDLIAIRDLSPKDIDYFNVQGLDAIEMGDSTLLYDVYETMSGNILYTIDDNGDTSFWFSRENTKHLSSYEISCVQDYLGKTDSITILDLFMYDHKKYFSRIGEHYIKTWHPKPRAEYFRIIAYQEDNIAFDFTGTPLENKNTFEYRAAPLDDQYLSPLIINELCKKVRDYLKPEVYKNVLWRINLVMSKKYKHLKTLKIDELTFTTLPGAVQDGK